MLIDLDVVPEQREPARRAGSKRYGVVLVSLLAVLLLAGSSGAPRGGGLVQVLKADGQGLAASLLTAGALYTVRADGLLEARPLCPGCPSWSVQTTAGQRIVESGGVLIIDANDAGVATFVDARSGAVLWSQDGFSIIQVVGGRVADWHPDDGLLYVRDLRTGRLFWKRAAGAFAGDEKRVVLFNGGQVASYASADGRELTGWRHLGVPGELQFAGPGASVQMIGERLIIFGAGYIAAYRGDGLERDWLTPVVSPFAVAGCGAGLLCTIGVEGTTVLDLATGRIRWNEQRWRLITEGGLVTDGDGQSARVDLATGRVEADFGRGRPIDDLVLYPEGDRTTLVGSTDGRVRGVIPRVTPDACSTAGDLFACLRYDSTVTVWRLRQR